jgi:hypothetical protein
MCSVCAPFRIGTAIIHWKHTPYLAQRVLRLESPTVPPTKLPSSISYVGVARGRTASVYSRGTLVLESGAADGVTLRCTSWFRRGQSRRIGSQDETSDIAG